MAIFYFQVIAQVILLTMYWHRPFHFSDLLRLLILILSVFFKLVLAPGLAYILSHNFYVGFHLSQRTAFKLCAEDPAYVLDIVASKVNQNIFAASSSAHVVKIYSRDSLQLVYQNTHTHTRTHTHTHTHTHIYIYIYIYNIYIYTYANILYVKYNILTHAHVRTHTYRWLNSKDTVMLLVAFLSHIQIQIYFGAARMTNRF